MSDGSSQWGQALKMFDRVKQFTEEIVQDNTPRTEYFELEDKIKRAEEIKENTEHLKDSAEAFFDPFKTQIGPLKIGRDKDTATPYHAWGEAMLKASVFEESHNDQPTPHKLCSDAYFHLGNRWLDFAMLGGEYVDVLRTQINSAKQSLSISKDLNIKRLDLDAAKSKVRKGDQNKMPQAQKNLKEAQYEFDRKYEEAEDAINEVQNVPKKQALALRKLVEQHRNYLKEAVLKLDTLLEKFPEIEVEKSPALSMLSNEDAQPLAFEGKWALDDPENTIIDSGNNIESVKGSFEPVERTSFSSTPPTSSPLKQERKLPCQARALYDYETAKSEEISLKCGSAVVISKFIDDEWVEATTEGKKGRVHVANLLILE